MEQPIREIRKNQADIYVTLENHTAMLQEIAEKQDGNTQRLNRLETTLAKQSDVLAKHSDLLQTLTTLATAQNELLTRLIEKQS
jgi:hypothetical protein